MKTTITVLLSLAAVLAWNQPVQAQFYYVTNNGTITITGYAGGEGPLGIPNTINGLPVTAIASFALAYATTSSITIGNSVTNIGDGALIGCGWIEVFTTNPNFASVAGVLFNKNLTTLVQYPDNAAGSYTIPDSVTFIAGDAFVECLNLTNVTIPNSVTSIGDFAFDTCGRLSQVTIPDGVTNVGPGAFESCFSVTNVTIGNGVARISDEEFAYCSSLTTVQIPDCITDIGNSAFGRSGLKSITFGANVTLLEGGAFFDCENLSSVPVLTGVTNIGDYVFEECWSLTNVTFSSNLTSIGEGAFFGSGLMQVTVPGSVTNLGDVAFDFCGQLSAINVDAACPVGSSIGGVLFDKSQTTLLQYPAGIPGSYAIPQGTVALGIDAFGGCEGLTEVTIPNSVTAIERLAFDLCSSLTNVTVGSGVTNLGSYAFIADTSLHRLYFQGNAPAQDGTEFEGVDDLGGNTNTTVYYLPGTSGWGALYGGLPTAAWYLPNPLILEPGRGFGVLSNQFGFTISWATNAAVVVDVTTNLAHAAWQPLATNTLVNGACYFGDPQSAGSPARFYRLHSP